MCFFIYAPSAKLQIEYASEFIKLGTNSSSEVIVDLLITNKSEKPVDHLKFLYPNRFYEITKKKKICYTGEWDDVTQTFLSDHEYNWVYKFPGVSINKSPSTQPPFAIPKWGTYCEISHADPRDTLEKIYYQGIIGGGIDLNLEEDFDYLQAKTLSNYNFTLFRCSLKQPLEKDIPRWMRFKFRGNCSIYNKERNRIKESIKRNTNQLHYEYQIFGPFDVRDRLKTYLATAKQYCDGRCSKDISIGTTDLYAYFINEGVISDIDKALTSETKIVHWYIHINPDKMGRITDINSNGNIQIAGLMPNYIGMNPKSNLKIYEWKTGFSNTENPEFKFNIFFQAKPVSLIYPLIPWIALFLAVGFNVGKIMQFLKSLWQRALS